MKTPAQKRNLSLIILNIGFVIFSVVLLGVGWFYLAGISKDTSKLNTESEFMGQESDVIATSIQRYNRVSDYSSVVLEALPNSKEISSFIADVSKIAASDNIKITQSTIGSGLAKENTTSQDLSQTTSHGNYNELQITYTADGSYQNFQKMLGDLGSLRRINSISAITITKNNNDPASDSITVTFVDSIFLKEIK